MLGLLAEDEGRQKSLLKVIYSDARDNAALLADWLAKPELDVMVAEKLAGGELHKLIGSRLGLEVGDEVPSADARLKTVRYVLVGEFRDDYQGEPPPAAAMIPSPATKEQLKFVQEVAVAFRQRHAEPYVQLADQVERELGFRDAALPPEKLGALILSVSRNAPC